MRCLFLQSVYLLGEEQPVSGVNLLGGQSVQSHDAFRGGLIFLGDIPEADVIADDEAYNAGHFLKPFQILRGFRDLAYYLTFGRGKYDGADT